METPLIKLGTKEKAFILLFIVLLLIYWPRGQVEFLIWDDIQHIQKNPYFTSLSLKKIFDLWVSQYGHLYIPFTYTIWSALVGFNQLLGISSNAPQNAPYIFVFSNILIHFINTILAYRLIESLLKTQSKQKSGQSEWSWPAFLGAVIFSIHPLQAESIAWMSGFKEMIWVTFAISSLNHFLAWLKNSRNSKGFYLALCLGLASILCKPTAVVLPIFYFILYVFFSPKKWQGAWAILAKSSILFLPFAYITKYLQPDDQIQQGIDLPEKVIVSVDTLIFYLKKVIFPLSLVPDYGHRPELVLKSLISLEFFLAITLIFIFIYYFIFKKKSQKAALSLLFFIVPLLPVSGLISFAFQRYSTVADRYVYFSMIGIGLMTAFAYKHLESIKKPPTFKVISIVPILLLGLVWIGLDYQQAQYWKTNESLFQYTLKINPLSFMAENNLGQLEFERSQFLKAKERFETALKLSDTYTPAQVNYGATLFSLGQKEESIKAFQKALKLDPTNIEASMNIGIIKLEQNLFSEAIPYLRSTIQENPFYPEGWNNLGIAYIRTNDLKKAVECFEKAASLDPHRPLFQNNLKRARDDLGRN